MRNWRGGLAGLAVGVLLSAAPVAAQEEVTISVAQDGSGDHHTISAALEAAGDGDTILLAPGEYVENLHVTKAVTLRGAGSREEIVIIPEPRPILVEVHGGETAATGIHVDGVDATIEQLSIGETEQADAGVVLDGGSPVLRDVVSPGITGVAGQVDALIEGSVLRRLNAFGPSVEVTVRDNTFDRGSSSVPVPARGSRTTS